jgi:hypothetical protein
MAEHILIHPPTSDAPAAMARMHAVACCSRFEAMGRTLIEASLLEVPVLFARCGGANEIFEHEKEALSYPVGDAEALASILRETLRHPARAAERARRAAARCMAVFSEETLVGPVFRLLSGLSPRRPPARGEPVWDLISQRFDPVTTQLFVSNEDQFSERASIRAQIKPGRRVILRFENLHRFFGTPGTGLLHLRFDPSDRPAAVRIYRARLITADDAEKNRDLDLHTEILRCAGLIPVTEQGTPFAALACDDDPQIKLAPITDMGTTPCSLEVELSVSDGMPMAANLLTTKSGPAQRLLGLLAHT